MEMYLENMKSLRSQMHVIEEEAAMRSIEEQKQKTFVGTLEKELQLVRSETEQLNEEVEEMVKTRSHINSEIAEKQRKLSSMQKESSVLSQTLELLQQGRVILSVKIKEKRSYYSKITEELNIKLKEQQDWFNSHKQKMIEDARPVEEYPSKPMGNHIHGSTSIMLSKKTSLENMGHEMSGRYKDLMTQLESAKNKLEEVEVKKSEINIASSKLKQFVEQLKHQIESVSSPLKEMDDNALEEEYKALMADKAREMEYLQSLKDQINQLEGISQVVTCQCGEEYRVELADGQKLGVA
ncbi:uveal autoantigen with coiled-coil domains and ankyrin repeats [Phoenix dactylifera]|uniref:Uveal autoantigen with coiled-coil domains and ankyrin repeats n=1 Tax=Phoenix dactylifera TaxID=42345 RepID=A0A8B8J7M3_PHODC|nr:uveal autoantigen with coiled-coil domains and ankyrin repeats [Phoenix dactylifera]XP_026662647.2 uveal autoantigen with coiled-coil domains and ankyrin repeats [Phoenix dactylifera]XP_026662648.2 uveal autoantigen with coiled-coil domains and ankyrin repeats [Phoenix dactylifera]XP_026662649.2 uveal autoantigen with coiled-coil domains and ankyrin repeats [Phoenix dactylifera]